METGADQNDQVNDEQPERLVSDTSEDTVVQNGNSATNSPEKSKF